jgi:TrmH family RNA methyltransferase
MWRERRALYLVEGHRSVAAGIRAGARIEEIMVTPSGVRLRAGLLHDARAAGAKVREVSPDVMAYLTSSTTAPDLLGIAPMVRSELRNAGSPAVLLAEVRDPANAGGVLAAAAATGIATAVASGGTVELHSPKVVRAAQGAHFVMRIVPRADTKETIERYRSSGARVVAVAREGIAPWQADLRGQVLFVVEGEGDDARAAALADERVAPPPGPVETSVAARAAAVLYERARQEAAR